MLKYLKNCHVCLGKGKVQREMGILKKCEACKIRRKIFLLIEKLLNWLRSNPFKTTPVSMAFSFFMLMSLLTYFNPHEGNFSVLVASFGAIFVALKYKLDQASYNKNLYEERYKIFIMVDGLLRGFFQDIDHQKAIEKMDSIFRKSYFLFTKNTYQFISDFRSALNYATYNYKNVNEDGILKDEQG